MDESPAIYNELNRAWKSTCRSVLGQEIGKLKDFEEWLSEHKVEITKRKSSLTGKEVAYAIPHYRSTARWASFEEVYSLKFEPLRIDQIKDIDSLLQAVQERVYYTGNIVLGNSKFISGSTNLHDCFYVLDSSNLTDMKQTAFTEKARSASHIFGCHSTGESTMIIRGYEAFQSTRGIEVYIVYFSSDCYYSFNLRNCQECFFCFNARSKRNAIGNLELAKDKYAGIKKKLLGELAEGLKKDHCFPSLLEIVQSSPAKAKGLERFAVQRDSKTNMEAINNGFAETTKTVLGKEIKDLKDYGQWLQKHVPGMASRRSSVSGLGLMV